MEVICKMLLSFHNSGITHKIKKKKKKHQLVHFVEAGCLLVSVPRGTGVQYQ